jgi:hypothetical protein
MPARDDERVLIPEMQKSEDEGACGPVDDGRGQGAPANGELRSGLASLQPLRYPHHHPTHMFTPEQDHGHLQLALAQARKSMAESGIPIGCAGLPLRRRGARR